jgi:hypothetical protein
VVEHPPHIGILREKPLHAALKSWYAEPRDRIENPIDGFVIGLVRDDLLIEIQTRGFSSMKKKVWALLERGHRVRIVLPIALDRWIVKIGDGGELLGRRRSPRHGSPLDVFSELVSFPELVLRPELELELVLVVDEEVRRHFVDGSWRRKGWTVLERRPVEVLETVRLAKPEDLGGLLPPDLGPTFTTLELAELAGISRRLAQQTAYCLRKVGVITAVGKVGPAVQYRRD